MKDLSVKVEVQSILLGHPGRFELEAHTVREVVEEIDRQHPGFRQKVGSQVTFIRRDAGFNKRVGLDDELPDGADLRIALQQIVGG